jgi:hypothetical protein
MEAVFFMLRSYYKTKKIKCYPPCFSHTYEMKGGSFYDWKMAAAHEKLANK